MKVIFEAIQVLVVIVLDDLSNLDIGRRIRRFIASEKKQQERITWMEELLEEAEFGKPM